MRRCVLILALGTAWLAAATSTARAQEEVFFRGKEKDESIKKAIKTESAGGIVLAGSKDVIPADVILDVVYEVKPLGIQVNQYRPARNAEKNANDPGMEGKRPGQLAEAIGKYEAALKGLDAGQTAAQRHLEYKIAYLTGIQAQEGAGSVDQAIARLKEFQSKHADCWQILSALKLLAGLQIAQKRFDDAETTYSVLAKANVPDEIKLEAELGAAQVNLRAKKYAQAQKRIQELLARLPKDTRVRIAEAEYLAAAAVANEGAATKKGDEARKKLQEIITASKDPSLKAIAYNALGQSYFDAGMFKEARWEFLWVDVVYNQDRSEHAKALYYLMLIFQQLNDNERALECRDALLNDRQFQGLEYQRLAREKKIP